MTGHFISAVAPPKNRTEPALWFAFANDKMLHYTQAVDVMPQSLEFSDFGLESVRTQYLGTLDGQHCYSVELANSVSPPEGLALAGLRQLYEPLGTALFAVAGKAIQIVDWERNHQYCGRCGAKTVDHTADRAKICSECKLVNYPRLSPSIIVLVRRGSELLLARSPRWTNGMYSVLAGFVEPGESLEQAVEREIMEEVGLTVKNIRYFGSQPWPFPNSLMLGFTAEYAGGEFLLDPIEIADARWFSAANLPLIPSKMSIARRLIDDFLKSDSG